MIRNYCLIVLSLLICLFIYSFYRTEKTVVNEIIISIISFDKFEELRKTITNLLLLNDHVIFSLPGGLWVFCITLTTKPFFFKVGNRVISLLYFPLIFSIGLELFQLLHLANGRFDNWDIGFSVLFWCIANYFITHKDSYQNILNPFTAKSVICLSSYLIIYLAHVWN